MLVIEGNNGTTIGGNPKVEIPLPAGKDRVTEVEVLPGAGDDVVQVDLTGLPDGLRLDEVGVKDEFPGSGNDDVKVKNVRTTAKGKIETSLGEGNDKTTLEGCDANKVNVVDTQGNNTTEVENSNIQSQLKIDHGNGASTVRVKDSFYGKGSIKATGSAGVDKSLDARIERSSGGQSSIQSGDGDDNVVFEDSNFESVSAKLGDGADLVSITGSVVDKASFDGGAGDLDCFDETDDNNVFGSLKQKGFENGACSGLTLLCGPAGQNPFDPPAEADAWMVSNGGHSDGPFALPGAENPFGHPEVDPAALPRPAHWGQGPECLDGMTQLAHIHDAFNGHGDPDSGGCGHGTLAWCQLVVGKGE